MRITKKQISPAELRVQSVGEILRFIPLSDYASAIGWIET